MSDAITPAVRQQCEERLVAVIAGEHGPADLTPLLEDEQLEVLACDCHESLLAQAPPAGPGLIVLCIEPEAPSLSAAVQPITRAFAHTPVVVVCPSIDPRSVRAALAAGAAGVVLHEELQRCLGPCLRAARAGLLCLPRRDWRQVEPPVLSSREKQVLGLVVMGYMNGQIAEQLFLAESTVKSHLSSAFSKLGVSSRNEAVARILDPRAGLGVGILQLGGEPLQALAAGAR